MFTEDLKLGFPLVKSFLQFGPKEKCKESRIGKNGDNSHPKQEGIKCKQEKFNDGRSQQY
jgi:hypothetical protein